MDSTLKAHTRTALVVEDDPEIRKLISAYLTRLKFIADEASDVKTAIKKLDAARPTLLCCDIMLPESSGYDVCEHVRATAALKDLPILVVSARAMPEDRAMAEEFGVRSYLIKPFTQADFVRAVERALAGVVP